jgi:hypothetical protein
MVARPTTSSAALTTADSPISKRGRNNPFDGEGLRNVEKRVLANPLTRRFVMVTEDINASFSSAAATAIAKRARAHASGEGLGISSRK